jgi:F-type H+-transporting ATPase subunit delta
MPNVASRYARALFDTGVAEGGGAERRYGELLESFVKSMGEIAEFRAVLAAPHISRDQKKAFLSGLFGDPADERFLRFLCILLDKGRLENVGLISLDYKGLLLASQNVLEALIESAFPLDDATVKKIAETFRKKTGAREIRASVRVVPDLVGGIRVSIGSAIYDGTARSGLDRLLTSMNTQGFHHGN